MIDTQEQALAICRYTGKPFSECTCDACESKQVEAGEWIQPIEKGYRMTCCDCGLVHVMDFRIYEGKIQFRAFRDAAFADAEKREGK